MRAGTLNSRVMVQRRGVAEDEWGQPLPEAWLDFLPLWANIKHLSGSQAIKAGAPTSIVQASIRIRYRTDIDAAMRVVHGTTVYEIKAPLPDEVRREYVDLVCEVVR